jgi:hypothetical protein
MLNAVSTLYPLLLACARSFVAVFDIGLQRVQISPTFYIFWVFTSSSLLAALALAALLLWLSRTSRLALLLRCLPIARNKIQKTVRALFGLKSFFAFSYLLSISQHFTPRKNAIPHLQDPRT